MSRGKYGAQAANRLARRDNEIIEELRAKLAAVADERDQAKRELAALNAKIASEANRIAEASAAVRVAELTEQLAEEQEARDADRERLCDEVFDLLRARQLPLKLMTGLAGIFGQGHRIGVLLKSNSRLGRRTNTSKANWVTHYYLTQKSKGPHVPRSM